MDPHNVGLSRSGPTVVGNLERKRLGNSFEFGKEKLGKKKTQYNEQHHVLVVGGNPRKSFFFLVLNPKLS